MAGKSKLEALKQKLDLLECPYTSYLSASALSELLTTPGPDRSKLLIWIFSRYDKNLADLLDSTSKPGTAVRGDSQAQKLLLAARSMCLCSQDDLALIKGETSPNRQLSFFDTLLGIVCAYVEDTDSSYETISMRSNNDWLDCLAEADSIFDPPCWKVELLPKDLQADVKKIRLKLEKGNSGPDMKQLAAQKEALDIEFEGCRKELEKLQETIEVQPLDKASEIETMAQLLSTVIRELRQQIQGFTHVYESDIGAWCQKSPPQLSQLGPRFRRVHGLLETFAGLFEDISSARQLHTKLTNHNTGDIQQLFARGSSSGHASNTSETFQKCLTVLEETLHRRDSNFTSRFPDLVVL